MQRYASIWFPYLLTEYTARKKPEFRGVPFVLTSRERGRMVIKAVSEQGARKGIRNGMVLADCKAIFPELEVLETEHGRTEQLLHALAAWCISYTPYTAVDLPEGLILDITGCAHYSGGEKAYLESIHKKLNAFGYTVKIAIADTIGAAWAVARFENSKMIVSSGEEQSALATLPPAALRLETDILTRMKKLGLQKIGSFIDMPHAALRRRFGALLPSRINQALGQEIEIIVPIKIIEPYQERLCCLEPIPTPKGIRIALEKLLEMLCTRLQAERLGLRCAVFRAYRLDGDIQHIEIGTALPSRDAKHIFRLFEHKIATLQPDLGFENFVLEAHKVEAMTDEQAAIWGASSQNDKKVAELLDRVATKSGSGCVIRYLPAERYWPEKSVKAAVPLWEKPTVRWRTDCPRPIHLLAAPELINVTAVMPDYPPILFRYKGKVFNITKSDGPERIEQEWWVATGLYRDYYCAEDETGARYWIFRSGPYDKLPQWFIHGFFA
ncbi:MAG: DNA polymerase Y family protein [Flavobacterium sp.]|nr:DNA polymerase Y family protein [Flavobacterium sp.]